MKIRSLILATIGAVSLAWTAWGHHSHANYQIKETTYLEGTVKESRWINPHTWILLEVKDDKGQPVLWTLEGGSPAAIARKGWKKEDIKVGDTIKVRCYRLKDGSNGCLLGFITPTGADEKEYD